MFSKFQDRSAHDPRSKGWEGGGGKLAFFPLKGNFIIIILSSKKPRFYFLPLHSVSLFYSCGCLI